MPKILYLLFLILFFIINTSNAENSTISPLSPLLKKELIANNIWQSGCPVALDDLRVVTVDYVDFEGAKHIGAIILNKSAASAAVKVFENLYAEKFPFTAIGTLIKVKGDINLAKTKNTTYGFICKQDDQNKFTKESYGNVITVNPVQNPQINLVWDKPGESFWCRLFPSLFHCKKKPVEISKVAIFPARGMLAINRSLKLKGMNEKAVAAFEKYGFTWSGERTDKINWSHFIFNLNKKLM